MPISKHQAQAELQRRAVQKELARRELLKRGQLQKKPTGFGGLVKNASTDFGSFAKGMLGVGRELITHPVYNAKKIGGVGVEAVKLIPETLGRARHDIANFGDTTRKARQSFQQLKKIPLGKQKQLLAQEMQKIGQAGGNDNQKKLAQMGLGVLGNYSQYSRFGEKVYEEPFSATLDAISLGAAPGASSVLKTGIKTTGQLARKVPVIAEGLDKANDAFVPMGKLKRLGYKDVADDIADTSTNMRKSQEGIIKSTIAKFDDEFKLTKPERVEFFEAIDKGRRVEGYVPTSPNPKIQKAIDWYMQKELPSIRKIAGYKAGKAPLVAKTDELGTSSLPGLETLEKTPGHAPIENYLHHFFNPSKETQFGGKLSSPQRGFLKQSKDVEGFSKDPVVSIAGVKSKAATANIKEGFIDRVFDKYGTKADDVLEFEGGKIINKATGEELAKYKGRFIPKELGDELARIEMGEPQWLKTTLEPLRAFNRNWKPLATTVRPRYHLRNIIGNVYNASFVGGANVKTYGTAIMQQMTGYIAKNMREGTLAGRVFKAMFKEAPEHKYIKMAIDDDVIGRGFFSADINDLAEVANTAEDFTKAIERMNNPNMVSRIPVLKQWMEMSSRVGQAFEDNARLALYIDRLKKGSSRAQAKAYVNKHLFDYLNGLGNADKAIKAFIPFWSWTRFNVPLQSAAIFKAPLRHLAVQQGLKPWVQENEANNPEYRYLSDREKAMGAIKIGEEEKDGKMYDKYMRTQSVLPVQDLGKIADPENLGVTPLGNMLMQAYRRVLPPDNPEENMDYFGRPVEAFPGEVKRYMGIPVRGTTKEIAQSIPFLGEINKAIGGSYTDETRPSLGARMGTTFSPTSQTIQDREKNRENAQYDFQAKTEGTYSKGYEPALKAIVKKIMDSPEPDKVLQRNKKVLEGLLRQMGYSDGDIQQIIEQGIQAKLKQDFPKPKRPSSMRPQRPSPVIDPYYQSAVQQYSNRLKPFY